MRRFGLHSAPWLAILLAAALPAMAQEAAGIAALTGTLRKVQASGTIALGYRESSLPFAFLDAARQPAGYSIDLCREVVEDIAAELNRASIPIAWRAVTPETRLGAVSDGTVDLECGSTTATAERRRQVAFSPIIFVAGTRLLVRQDSPVRSLRDLAGQAVAVTAGTTNEAAVRALSERQGLGLRFVVSPDHAQSYARLAAGEAAAFASDDVLLQGWIAATEGGRAWRVTGDFLSYEPYGLVYRRDDPAFTALVERSFARMATEGRWRAIYTRWFLRRLPNGQRLDLPMSRQLEEVIRMSGEPE
jgi:ABC-type amino acid transport substrate-binding protein